MILMGLHKKHPGIFREVRQKEFDKKDEFHRELTKLVYAVPDGMRYDQQRKPKRKKEMRFVNSRIGEGRALPFKPRSDNMEKGRRNKAR